jgi:Ca2+/Na+ antiporter
MVRLLDVLFEALAMGTPWYLWGIWWWFCLLLALFHFAMTLTRDVSSLSTRTHILWSFGAAIVLSAPLWALGYGGWQLLVGAFAVLLVVAFVWGRVAQWRENQGFHERYTRVQEEKRRRPDYTGMECYFCGNPVRPTVGPRAECPHCHKVGLFRRVG